MTMLSPDRGFRNLLPILDEEPDEVVLIADSDGIRVRSTVGAETSTSQALHHGIDPAMPGLGSALQAMDAAGPSDISATHNSAGSSLSAKASEPLESMKSPSQIDAHESDDQSFSGSTSTHAPSSLSNGTVSRPMGAGDTIDDGPDASFPREHASVETNDRDAPESGPTLASGLPPGAGTPSGMPGQMPIPIAVPDGDDLHIVQTAFVDQDADVLLNGWIGDSKIRIFMENDADIDQDVDIDLDYDSSGRMFLRLNQFMTIDQETEIDLDIYEVKGVLYVDLHLRNEVDVEQDTELDLMMGGWNGGSLVYANNDLDVRQHTDVDIDIDDDLEEQFKIKVAVGIKQAIHADQDADIDLTYANGAFGVDLDAIQTATIEQDTTLKIDFSVI
jgi:hypothetical protein